MAIFQDNPAGTGIRGPMRGLATLPSVHPGAFSGQKQGRKTPRGPPVVHCFCVCSGCALLADLFGLSRFVECDLLSVLSYPWFPLTFIVPYHFLLGMSSCVVSYNCFLHVIMVVYLSVLAKKLARKTLLTTLVS